MVQTYGNIQSIENCSNVDGPGARLTILMQGCPMRCMYCYNPESWNFNVNKKMSVDEIIQKYETNKETFKNVAGITVSGGEPLSQIDFVVQLFKVAKEKNIHTALDTSGAMFNRANVAKFDELMNFTDLVLLDIKHIDPVEHKKFTGFELNPILDFALYLSDKKIPVWIRHIVVPRVNASQNNFIKLGEFLSKLNNIQALDVLPFQNKGQPKFEQLGLNYYLKGVPSLTKQEAEQARSIILETMRKARSAR